MTLITRRDLQGLSTPALRTLLRRAFQDMAASSPQTHQRRNALASLETIQAELNARPDGP